MTNEPSLFARSGEEILQLSLVMEGQETPVADRSMKHFLNPPISTNESDWTRAKKCWIPSLAPSLPPSLPRVDEVAVGLDALDCGESSSCIRSVYDPEKDAIL